MGALEINLLLLAPLILGMFLGQLLKFRLKEFQGVYLFLGAAYLGVSFFLKDQWLWSLLGLLGGLVVLLILSGIFGTGVRPNDYAFFQFGVGLFPWWGFPWETSLIFVILLAGVGVLIALRPKFRNPWARKKR